MIVLQAAWLTVRPFVPADLEPLAALHADRETQRFYPDGTRIREQTQQEPAWFMNDARDHPELGPWATVDRATGAFLGRCGLLRWVLDGAPEADLAFMI